MAITEGIQTPHPNVLLIQPQKMGLCRGYEMAYKAVTVSNAKGEWLLWGKSCGA